MREKFTVVAGPFYSQNYYPFFVIVSFRTLNLTKLLKSFVSYESFSRFCHFVHHKIEVFEDPFNQFSFGYVQKIRKVYRTTQANINAAGSMVVCFPELYSVSTLRIG